MGNFKIYPTAPVVTTHADLASWYDDHPMSIGLTSACISPMEAEALLDAGATFTTILFVNGAGADLIDRVLEQCNGDEATHTSVAELAIGDASVESVRQIHRAIRGKSQRMFYNFGG